MTDRLAEIEARLESVQTARFHANAYADVRDLLAVAKVARDVDREWRERGDGGCTTELRLALGAALADLEGGA